MAGSLLLLVLICLQSEGCVAYSGVRLLMRPIHARAVAQPQLCVPTPPPAEGSQKIKDIDRQFLFIAAPAFLQFSAEPLARLVDTTYLGRLGKDALGGAGVAIAAQYSVSKLYNDPLLRTTISLVAAKDGEGPTVRANAVSTALLLALVVGVVQGAFFFVFARSVLRLSLVTPESAMYPSALAYLRICSLGAPAATLWLATNGIFRGLGDTTTPLACALAFTGLNAIFDPLLIFNCGMGAAGAAAGTAMAQTIALVPLLLALQRKLKVGYSGAERPAERVGVSGWPIVGLFVPPGGLPALLAGLRMYLSAGSLVFLRSIGKISAYSVCAREAARLGAVASGAHNLCFQLGVATTQIAESVAIATQTLLARELGRTDVTAPARTAVARQIVSRGLLVGGAVAGTLSLLTFRYSREVVNGLTTIPEVRAAAYGVMPLVLACQALKGLAYPVSGALMGALDWRASAAAMWAAQLSAVSLVAIWSQRGARPLSLNQLWSALAVLFVVQILAGLGRIASGTGPWVVLRRPRPVTTVVPDAKSE